MFRGAHKLTVSASGTFSLPKAWRSQFEKHGWICFVAGEHTAGDDAELSLYPSSEKSESPLATINAKGAVRLAKGIDPIRFKDALLIGQGDHIELWPKAAFEKSVDDWRKNAPDIAIDPLDF